MSQDFIDEMDKVSAEGWELVGFTQCAENGEEAGGYTALFSRERTE